MMTLSMDMVISGLIIFFCRMTDVTLGTIRMIMIVRGKAALAALIGFVEVSIFILAISHVVNNIGNVFNLLGYSGGFALGCFLGVRVENKIAPGFTHVQIVSTTLGRELADILRRRGFGVTEIAGKGIDGRVDILTIVAKRRDINEIIQTTKKYDREAFIWVDDTRLHHRGFFRMKKK